MTILCNVNNWPFIFADDFPHCGQPFTNDAIFAEAGGDCTEIVIEMEIVMEIV